MTHLSIRLATVGIAGAAALTLGASGAFATSAPTVTQSATTVAPGGSITFTGAGCTPADGQDSVISIGVEASDGSGGFGDADEVPASGHWTYTLPVDTDQPTGTYDVTFGCHHYDGSGFAYAATSFVVGTASPAGSVTESTVVVGGQTTVSGSGFTAGEAVTVVLHSTPVTLTSVHAASTGIATATVTIPSTTTPGAHELVLTGATSGHVVTIAITVAGASDSALPFTGTPAIQMLILGGGLALGGTALTTVGARRLRSRSRLSA